jgi:GNAT superfamily N-acetyltransferase
MITVAPITSKSEWNAFKKVPQTIYRNDPNWIPDELVDLDALLINPKPFRRKCVDCQAYVAYDGGAAVGRIVAIEDHKYNNFHGDRVAFFGFYEAINSDEVAFRLLDAAANWARQRSLTRLCGPLNTSMVSSDGLLINGYERPALVGMPYNPEYYAGQLSRWGMHKVQDLHSELLLNPFALLSSKRSLWERWRLRSSVTLRSVDKERVEQEAEVVKELYNVSFCRFFGFTPLDREEFLELVKSFLPILDEDLILFAEIDGRCVGFLMLIPDVNQALIKAARSRNRLLRNLITLWYWKGPGRRRTMRHARCDMLMVHPDCRDAGAAGLLVYEMFRRAQDKGYSSIEAAPLLEGNTWLRSGLAIPPGEPHRVYRVYGYELGTGQVMIGGSS